jgi:eukaryotic-like serine/threonine-protein kinase
MQSGQVIDRRFRLINKIADGGMGSVWLAVHETLEREVAIKFMRSDDETTPAIRQRFIAEARVVGRLRHPNIVDVVDSGELDDGTLFIVFEKLVGESLDTLLDRKGWLSVHSAVRIAAEVCRALTPAHAAGVVHRDLKPGNVFLHERGDGATIVKILDFGISKIRDAAASGARLTQAGTVIGTPSYMSFEQARGQSDVDHRTDVWAVGVLIYEMLTGRPPFEGEAYGDILDKIIHDEPVSIGQAGRDVPEELVVVADRCMAKDRTQRYATAKELCVELERLLQHLPEDDPDVVGLTRASEPVTPPEAPALRRNSPPPPPRNSPPPPPRSTPRRDMPTPRIGLVSHPSIAGVASTPSAPISVPSGFAPCSSPCLSPRPSGALARRLSRRGTVGVLAGACGVIGVVVASVLLRASSPADALRAPATAAPPRAAALVERVQAAAPVDPPPSPVQGDAIDLDPPASSASPAVAALRTKPKAGSAKGPSLPAQPAKKTRVDNPGF